MSSKQAQSVESCTLFCCNGNWNTAVGVIATQLSDFGFKLSASGTQKTLETVARNSWFNEKTSLKMTWSPFLPEDEQRDALIDFIQQMPGRNSVLIHHCALFAHHVQGSLKIEVTPSINEVFDPVIKSLAEELNALLFTDDPGRFFTKSNHPHFLDHDFNLVLDNTGNSGLPHFPLQIPKSNQRDQDERKMRSLYRLEQLGVAWIEEGPLTPSSEFAHIRTVTELSQRAYCLLAIAIRGEGIKGDPMKQFIEEKKIGGFSVSEAEFMDKEEPIQDELELARLRYESLYVLLWAMGLVDQIPKPNEEAPLDEIMEVISAPDRDEFEQRIRVREPWQILDETDFYLRCYVSCDAARERGADIPKLLNTDLVFERLMAFAWLIKLGNKSWDDVTVDVF
jgi:hypothetical protein